MHFLNNKCIINSQFWDKTINLRKKWFSNWPLYYFLFFCLVMCHESQTWGLVAIEKMYIIYFMHIDLIQSSSSNHWTKFNFDSKWALNYKILSCTFWSFLFYVWDFKKNSSRFQLTTYLSYLLYIIFLDEKWLTCNVFSPLGERTIWGGQLGQFYNMCIKYTPPNVLHLIMGFIFGVWAFYFDFQNFNVI